MLLVSDLEAAGGRDADLAYMRVAGDIAARIASGELRPGARLRAERDLAEYYEVSYGTVRRAMQVLRERALITTIHGRGTFVSGAGNSSLSRDGSAGLYAVPRLAVPTGCQFHCRSGPHWITRLTALTVMSHRGTSCPSAAAMGAMGCLPVL